MSGERASRAKVDRIERELVNQHKEIGIHAERYPPSGVSRFRGAGHHADIDAFGCVKVPIVAAVNGRKSGTGFTTIERWLGEHDVLFLKRNNADPFPVIPWRIWARLLEKVRA